MTTLDAIDDARDALRSLSGDSASASETRRRILLAASARPRRRRPLALGYVIPVAALLGLSSAWAAGGNRLEKVGSSIAALFRTSDARDARFERETAAAAPIAAASIAPAPIPFATASSPSDSSTAETVTVPVPDIPARRPVAVSRVAGGSAKRPDPSAEELRLYATAHAAHFTAHDDARALDAWTAYLAAYPHGRFEPDARYNRAMNLVRLGRVGEARDVLQAFAGGAYGGYRQREAKELVANLTMDAAPE